MTLEARTNAEREAMARTSAEQREHERRAVAEHYQHDPSIFSMVLDRRLAYATAIFETPSESLDAAQERKYARIAVQLGLRTGERLLDVGCGWGSNLLYLAEHTPAIVHGITLSAKQRDVALARARELGVADRVSVELSHVEDLASRQDTYDAILFSGSIVHMHNRQAVHQLAARLLRPGGRLLISDCYFPVASRGDRESAATQYIFVEALGYCRLLSLAEELALIEGAGLDVVHVEDLTRHYVRTLECWIDNVRKNRRKIEELAPGFSAVLQQYMTIARLSFARRTALEYMVLATKGPPRADPGKWPLAPSEPL
jgi:cyclopropane-fatty-acyl-phospholipid synthase